MSQVLDIKVEVPDAVSEQSLKIAEAVARQAIIITLQQRGELTIREAAAALNLNYEGYLQLLSEDWLRLQKGAQPMNMNLNVNPLEDVGMSEDAGRNLKDRLRADLRAAMKERNTFEANVIRALVAAIDNAEAPPTNAGQTALGNHHFHSGSAEVERLLLSRSDVRQALSAEVHKRERAAAEMERLGMMDRAEALRAEALLAKRYLE